MWPTQDGAHGAAQNPRLFVVAERVRIEQVVQCLRPAVVRLALGVVARPHDPLWTKGLDGPSQMRQDVAKRIRLIRQVTRRVTPLERQVRVASKRVDLRELVGVIAFGAGNAEVVEDELQVRVLFQVRHEQVGAAWKPGKDGHLVPLRGGEERVEAAVLEQLELARFGDRHDSQAQRARLFAHSRHQLLEVGIEGIDPRHVRESIGMQRNGLLRERMLAPHRAVGQEVPRQMPALGDGIVEAGPFVDEHRIQPQRVHGRDGVIDDQPKLSVLPVAAQPVQMHLRVDDVHVSARIVYDAIHEARLPACKAVPDRDAWTTVNSKMDARGMSLAAIPDGMPVGSAAIHSVCLDRAPGDSLSGAQQAFYNHLYAGRFEAIRAAAAGSAVGNPQARHGFVGREWLRAKLQRFLAEHDRGYCVLEAEAGLGKSAFLADLVAREAYIHHFVRGPANTPNEEQAIGALAAQLLIAWPGCGDGDDLQTEAVRHSDYLKLLLDAAADRRDTLAPGEKIVLVVDGLDQLPTLSESRVIHYAGTFENPLGLPTTLPRGVYVIVSMRPVGLVLHISRATPGESDTPLEHFTFTRDHAEHIRDIRTYLERVAQDPDMQRAITTALPTSDGCSPSVDTFVQMLVRKCEGVWLYLHYVVSDLGRAERPALDLEALPTGLWQYYVSFWRDYRARHDADWPRWYEPLLSTLAVIQEPVPLDRLVALSGIAVNEPADLTQLADVLGGDWGPFIRCSEGGWAYELYHHTLRSFLQDDLAAQTRDAHARIAGHYLTRWGGLERGLPDLPAVPRLRDATLSEPAEQRYGRRYLALHMANAGAESRAQLFDLLTLDQPTVKAPPASEVPPPRWFRLPWTRQAVTQVSPRRPTNRWYAYHENAGLVGDYVSQVNLAWRRAEDQSHQSNADRGSSVGWELRFALMQSSINARAENLPVDLLLALVRCGCWDAYQAWAFADRIPAPGRRAVALAEVARLLKPKWQERILRDAVAAALWFDAPRSRAASLIDILPVLVDLSDSWYTRAANEALRAALAIPIPDARAQTLARLTRHLPRGLLAEVRAAAGSISAEEARSRVMVAVVSRASVLASPPDGVDWVDEAFGAEAIQMVREVTHSTVRPDALTEIIRRAPGHMLEGVERLVSGLPGPRRQAECFIQLVGREAQTGRIDQAFKLARAMPGDLLRARAIASMAPYLPDAGLTRGLELADSVEEPAARACALAGLAPHLSSVERTQAFAAALAATRDVISVPDRAEALERVISALQMLAPLVERGAFERAMADGLLKQADKIRLDLRDPAIRADLRALVAVCAAGFGSPRAALVAAQAIDHRAPRVRTLLTLAQTPTDALLDDLLDAAANERREDRARILAVLARTAATPARQPFVLRALNEVRGIGDEAEQVTAWSVLAANLSETELGLALDTASEVEDEDARATAFRRLARLMSPALVQRGIQRAEEIEDTDARGWALAGLDPRGKQSGKRKGAASDWTEIKDPERWAEAALERIPRIARSDPEGALQLLALFPNNHWYMRAWEAIVPLLSDEHRNDALASARVLSDPVRRAEIFAAAVPHVPPSMQHQLATDALKAAIEGVQFEWSASTEEREEARVRVLAKVARLLPGPQRDAALSDAIDAVRRIVAEEGRVRALAHLAPLLHDVQVERALEYARAITNPAARASSLQVLVRGLPDSSRSQVADEIAAAITLIDDGSVRARALADAVLALADLPRDRQYEVWTAALHALASRTRRELLAKFDCLSPATVRLGGAEAVSEVATGLRKSGQWWP
jgi:hypothetical protein